MRIAVIGAGKIGTLRASVAARAGDQVTAVVDTDVQKATDLAARYGSRSCADWQEPVSASDIDALIVATVTHAAAPIAIGALSAGKHVLYEKPMGRDEEESRRILAAARDASGIFKVGFNHRHHPAVDRAHKLAVDGAIGDVVGVRAAYGHGGRPGYEREWRTDPFTAGGGELLDQGVHLIDLARWFLGDFSRVCGATATWYWPIRPLEDNAFALLSTADGKIASLHASWTQWRNMFRFEILGSEGYLSIDGLGGSYGTERLTRGHRRPDWTLPDEERWEFDGPDTSWTDEWSEFREAVHAQRRPMANAEDGYAVALIVDAIYRAARGASSVELAKAAAVQPR